MLSFGSPPSFPTAVEAAAKTAKTEMSILNLLIMERTSCDCRGMHQQVASVSNELSKCDSRPTVGQSHICFADVHYARMDERRFDFCQNRPRRYGSIVLE